MFSMSVKRGTPLTDDLVKSPSVGWMAEIGCYLQAWVNWERLLEGSIVDIS